MATYLFANNAQTTIPGALTNSATSITVQSGSAFSTPGTGEQFVARIDDTGTPGSTKYEYVLVTANSASVFTVTRGVEGTSGQSFAGGATITQVFTAGTVTSTPRGTLGYAQIVGSFGITTTATDVAGLAVTVTVGAGRRIRVTGYVPACNGISNSGNIQLLILEGATQLTQAAQYAATGFIGASLAPQVILSPSSGAHTYKLQVSCQTGTANIAATANQPAFILCEDIGQ